MWNRFNMQNNIVNSGWRFEDVQAPDTATHDDAHLRLVRNSGYVIERKNTLNAAFSTTKADMLAEALKYEISQGTVLSDAILKLTLAVKPSLKKLKHDEDGNWVLRKTVQLAGVDIVIELRHTAQTLTFKKGADVIWVKSISELTTEALDYFKLFTSDVYKLC